jgi:hypothetical protein
MLPQNQSKKSKEPLELDENMTPNKNKINCASSNAESVPLNKQ